MAKTQLNYVKVINPIGDLTEGDIVPLNQVTKELSNTGNLSKVSSAIGKILTKPIFEHTVGTPITRRIAEDILSKGKDEIECTDRSPVIQPIMAAATRTPLLNPNWLQRLGYRYQKDTLIDAASYGQKGTVHGYDPMAALALGKEFRRGEKGEY